MTAESKPPRKDQPVVLVVEDDPDVRHLLSHHLVTLGYRVRTATSGEQGLHEAEQDPPDVAVVDVLLPDIDGIEVMTRLREPTSSRSCTIVLTSVLDQGRRFLAADSFLAKPFTFEDVRRAMTIAVQQQTQGNRP